MFSHITVCTGLYLLPDKNRGGRRIVSTGLLIYYINGQNDTKNDGKWYDEIINSHPPTFLPFVLSFPFFVLINFHM